MPTRRTCLLPAIGLALFLASPPAATAGSAGGGGADPSSIADREIARRQLNIERAQNLMAEGRKALGFKDYETAYVKFLDAVELLPPALDKGKPRKAAVAEFSAVALQYANWLVDQGRFEDAEQVAKTVLLPEFNPSYRPAVVFLSRLEQPGVFNKTVTPQFAAQREEINRLFQEAEGFYASGRFDLATKRYNQILEIDPYNKAARAGMEQVDNQRQKYFQSAYNETRSRMLWEVTKMWETPVPRSTQRESTAVYEQAAKGTEAIQAKLNRTIIPRINLNDTTLREAIAFLQQQSVRLDNSPDEAKRGVNIVLRLDAAGQPAEGETPSVSPTTRVTLNLNHVPLAEALRYLAEMVGLRVKVEPYAVTLVPLSVPVDSLVMKEYRVPAGFIPPSPPEESTGFTPRGAVTTKGPAITNRIDAKKFLEDQGISFPPGATANYIPQGSKLVVRNTPDNIDLIDNIVNATVGVAPTQVEIESKFLEVNQNNLAELGFDWLLGPFSIGGGLVMSGGDTRFDTAAYPFGGPTFDGASLTNGLRSGSGNSVRNAISANSIDALLAGVAQGFNPAPAVFGIGGIFTNPQFQVLIRALDQKKGIDLMSAPKVTTKSGQRAEVQIVRQFYYPTVFEPPVIPTNTAGGNGTTGPLTRIPPTITPSFPSGWQEKNIGVSLGVLPTVGGDSYTIDLNLTPSVIDFEGFINYGSPINTLGYTESRLVPGRFEPISQTLTENTINQPIFNNRKVETEVTIWDGQTVSLGGLISEETQKVEDKVPILGDIPLAGRLFRSNADQKIKKNLIIFVTATIIDAEGRPIRRAEEEEEEIVEPLGLPERLTGPQFPSYKGGGIRMK